MTNPRTPENLARMAQLWHAGMSAPKIAAALGCSAPTLRRMADEAGLPKRVPVVIDEDDLRRRWLDGQGARTIAEDYGCCRHKVARTALAMGLAPHHSGGQLGARRGAYRTGLHDKAMRSKPVADAVPLKQTDPRESPDWPDIMAAAARGVSAGWLKSRFRLSFQQARELVGVE